MSKYLAGPETPVVTLAVVGASSLAYVLPRPLNIILPLLMVGLGIWALYGMVHITRKAEQSQDRLAKDVREIKEAMKQAGIPQEQQEQVLKGLKLKATGTIRWLDERDPQSPKDDQ